MVYRAARIETIILGVLTLGLLLTGCGPEPASRGHVVLIGLDGASWNLLDPMIKAGELPHFKALMDRGVAADLASVPPFLSPPVWTSIATSRMPEDHGVFYFYSNRNAIKVPTVWDRLAAGGLRVGLYDYLVTWPPRRFPHSGFSVPGWLRRDESVWPPDLFRRIGLPRSRLHRDPLADRNLPRGRSGDPSPLPPPAPLGSRRRPPDDVPGRPARPQ
jgi:Type I phosphodiesterase / nucleotide pyrophosphatase